MVKIAIICGTGLDNLDFPFGAKPSVKLLGPIDTPFGQSSDLIIGANVNGVEVVLVARHGQHHVLNPSQVNYRANLWAVVNKLHCDAVIASSACVSIRGETIKLGDLCLFAELMDFTAHGSELRGPYTFHDGRRQSPKGVLHANMGHAFSKPLRDCLAEAARAGGFTVHNRTTCITVEGPRLSTTPEVKMFRTFGGDVIDQTTVPEVILAKELGIPYAVIAFVMEALPKSAETLNEESTSFDHRKRGGADDGDDEDAAYDVADGDTILQNVIKHAPLIMRTIVRALPDIAKMDLASMRKPQSAI